MSAYERDLRRAQRQNEFEHWLRLNQELAALGQAHLQHFPVPARPLVEPQPVDADEILSRHERSAVDGIAWYRRGERRLAKEAAVTRASAEAEAQRERNARAAAHEQKLLDESWDKLLNNDFEQVLSALEAAFEDNEAPAAAIDCRHGEVTVVMRFPEPDAIIPERMVGETPTGRPTTRKRSKTDRNDLYAEVMASHVLATVKEALAVAPGLREVRLLAIREEDCDDGRVITPIYCGRFEREHLDDLNWDNSDPLTEIEIADGVLEQTGRTRELRALDLRDEPEMRQVVQQIGEALALPVNPASLRTRRSQRKASGEGVTSAPMGSDPDTAEVPRVALPMSLTDSVDDLLDAAVAGLEISINEGAAGDLDQDRVLLLDDASESLALFSYDATAVGEQRREFVDMLRARLPSAAIVVHLLDSSSATRSRALLVVAHANGANKVGVVEIKLGPPAEIGPGAAVRYDSTSSNWWKLAVNAVALVAAERAEPGSVPDDAWSHLP